MEKGFVAYVGTEIGQKEIADSLDWVCTDRQVTISEEYKSQIFKFGNAILGQANESNIEPGSGLPKYDYGLMYVASYDHENLEMATKGLKIEDSDYDTIDESILWLLKDCDISLLSQLAERGLNYAFACYDPETKDLTAVKIGNCDLFYGYTKKNHEIIFSDYESVLRRTCGYDQHTFPDNSCYKNGRFYEFEKKTKTAKKTKKTNPQTLETSNQQQTSKGTLSLDDAKCTQTILDKLNEILPGNTDATLRANVEKAFNEYFQNLELNKKIDELVDENIKLEIQKKLLEITKTEVEKFDITQQVQKEINQISHRVQEKLNQVPQQFGKEIDEKLTTAVQDYMSKIAIPQINIIKLGETELGKTKVQVFHEKFEEVLSLVQLDEPVMLIGPAGSGKNHAISQISQALGYHMYYTNNATNEFKLTGFIDAGGTYRDTEFYKAFKDGGIFFLDEIDTSDPSALIVINSALANGYMAFPNGTIDRHKNFRMVAAANTWGNGADLQYIGRNALDGATLDRFDNVFFDYDRKLERALYPNDEILEFMWSLRDAVDETKIPHIVSTRGIGKVYKKELNGIPIETILRTNVIRNLGQDDLNILLRSMQIKNKKNKYYEAAKTLKLEK